MKKKILITMVVLFNIAFLVNANQTLWLDCPGKDVPVSTVDREYFLTDAEYDGYIEELKEVYCP